MPLNGAIRLSSDWLCDSYAEGVVCLSIDGFNEYVGCFFK